MQVNYLYCCFAHAVLVVVVVVVSHIYQQMYIIELQTVHKF